MKLLLLAAVLMAACQSEPTSANATDRIRKEQELKQKRLDAEIEQTNFRTRLKIEWAKQRIPQEEIERRVDSMIVADSIYLNLHYDTVVNY